MQMIARRYFAFIHAENAQTAKMFEQEQDPWKWCWLVLDGISCVLLAFPAYIFTNDIGLRIVMSIQAIASLSSDVVFVAWPSTTMFDILAQITFVSYIFYRHWITGIFFSLFAIAGYVIIKVRNRSWTAICYSYSEQCHLIWHIHIIITLSFLYTFCYLDEIQWEYIFFPFGNLVLLSLTYPYLQSYIWPPDHTLGICEEGVSIPAASTSV